MKISGRDFLAALTEAGVIAKGDLVRRVVIDAGINDAVMVYVERFGDKRLLSVAVTLEGIQVKGVPT